MKIHNDFTLYFRVVPSGKRVVYFYAYDENGKRLYGKSTGETTLTAARVKCNRLFKDGVLAAKKNYVPTFAEYAKGWWEWDTCPYLQKRRKRYNLTEGYAYRAKRNMKNVLLPHFGNMPMNKITRNEIERFLDALIQKKYKNTSINGYYATLKTMLIEAADRKIIASNPTEKVGNLVNDRKEIRIITSQEFKKLFVGDWQKVWDGNRIACTANKLAALTGMRSSEVLGLKGPLVFDGHIYLCKQFDRYGYRDTKTKNKHNIPLPAGMIADLKELKRLNGEDGYLFSRDGGAKPVGPKTIYNNFHKALNNIGINAAEIRDRKLHIHAWRHFFNTEMLKGGLSVVQAQAITGHKTERMTDWYCHFDPTEFAKAKAVQESLLQPEPEKPQEQAAATAENKTDTEQTADKPERQGCVLQFPVKQPEELREPEETRKPEELLKQA
jgi:integrase